MDALIKESWLIYERHRDADIVVTPSIPIFFFGDSRGYFEIRDQSNHRRAESFPRRVP